jgi:hypothetical protein
LAQGVTQGPVERLAETSRGRNSRRRERAYDDATAGREVVEPDRHQVPQSAQNPVSHHGGADGPRHHETHTRRVSWLEPSLRRAVEVHSKQPGPAAAASPDGRSELGALAQPGRCRQHVA